MTGHHFVYIISIENIILPKASPTIRFATLLPKYLQASSPSVPYKQRKISRERVITKL